MAAERITIRLPTSQVSQMDTLVQLGQYATRTEVVRSALRMFFEHEGGKATEVIAAEKGMLELQKMAAEKERLQMDLRKMLGQLDSL